MMLPKFPVMVSEKAATMLILPQDSLRRYHQYSQLCCRIVQPKRYFTSCNNEAANVIVRSLFPAEISSSSSLMD
jgi:hypothetical protein